MNQTWDNYNKSNFGNDFGPFGTPVFFFENLTLEVPRYHGQLSSRSISEKINYPILRKFSVRWTDGQTDLQTDRCTRVIS